MNTIGRKESRNRWNEALKQKFTVSNDNWIMSKVS